jgi:hypothetical protein
VLLDFGATRELPIATSDAYREVLRAGLLNDQSAIRAAALKIGFFSERIPPPQQAQVMRMVGMIMQPLRQDDVFDFGKTDIAARLRNEGFDLASNREAWHLPPMDTLFPQRKFGGMFLLGCRLKARVPLRELVRRYL